MPSVGFVVGNGISREGFDLERLRGYGTIVGCNQLYKDFDPNYLVAIDTAMVAELNDYREPHKWKLVTRGVWNNEHTILCDGQPVCRVEDINCGLINNGGLLATAFFAEILCFDEIYLIGIDFFHQVPDRKNNIYGYNTRQGKGIQNVWNTLPSRNRATTFFRVGHIPMSDMNFYTQKLKGFKCIDYDQLPIGKEI